MSRPIWIFKDQENFAIHSAEQTFFTQIRNNLAAKHQSVHDKEKMRTKLEKYEGLAWLGWKCGQIHQLHKKITKKGKALPKTMQPKNSIIQQLNLEKNPKLDHMSLFG